MDEHRSYVRREGLFGGFPTNVDWFRARVTREEVLAIRYIAWDWWLRITDGTRRPTDAACRIRAGELPGVTVEEHRPIAELVRQSTANELIVVTTRAQLTLVALEGHVRLTAYALFPDYLPDEVEILVGFSDEFESWWAF